MKFRNASLKFTNKEYLKLTSLLCHIVVLVTVLQIKGLRRACTDTHVLMIVGDDADALCAHTILTQLFIWDDVSYSMVPVGGWDALDKILRQHFDQIGPTIVLLNCGGNRSLQDLQVPPESIVFVIDSRRPFHHENIFDGHQIRLLVDSVEIDQLKIPEIHDVIDEEESDEEESEEEPDDEIVKKGEKQRDSGSEDEMIYFGSTMSQHGIL
uniref:LSDAT_euk domain-containing protein n=1 Tax=Heterorhabditis bacteriophora TaxID=37862 RepID=A0A1I7XHX5_HETBA